MKKVTILLVVVVVAVVGGFLIVKSQSNPTANNTHTPQTGTPTPTPSPTSEANYEDAAGTIKTISPQKIVIQDKDGNIIDVLLNDQVRYYDKGIGGGRERKEISFSSFEVGEWIGVRGWASHPDPTKPATTMQAEAVFELYPPGEAPESGE